MAEHVDCLGRMVGTERRAANVCSRPAQVLHFGAFEEGRSLRKIIFGICEEEALQRLNRYSCDNDCRQ